MVINQPTPTPMKPLIFQSLKLSTQDKYVIDFMDYLLGNKKSASRKDLQIIARKWTIACLENGSLDAYYVENNAYWRKRLYYKDGTPKLFRRVNFSGGINNNKTIISAEYKGVKSNVSGALILIQLGAKIKYGNTQIGELIL